MEKEDAVHAYSEASLSLGKEGTLAICNNMDEPGGHRARWNQPTTEGQTLHESTCMRSLEASDSQKQRVEGGCQGLRARARRAPNRGVRTEFQGEWALGVCVQPVCAADLLSAPCASKSLMTGLKCFGCFFKIFSILEYSWFTMYYFQVYRKMNYLHIYLFFFRFFPHIVVVQLLIDVWLFGTPRTAAHQASLPFAVSWGLLKRVSVGLGMPPSRPTPASCRGHYGLLRRFPVLDSAFLLICCLSAVCLC